MSNVLLVVADGDHRQRKVLSVEQAARFGLRHGYWVGGFAAARVDSCLSMPTRGRPLLQMRLQLANYRSPLRVEEVEVPYRESLSSRDMAEGPSLVAVAVGKKEVVLQEAHILMTDDSVEVQEEQCTQYLTKMTPDSGVVQEEPDTSLSARYCAAAAAAAGSVDNKGYLTSDYVDQCRRKALKSCPRPSSCPLVS